MKIRTEVKIGFIVLITLALVIYGINFLKGRNVLRRTDVFYAVFPEVSGLNLASPVYINGYKIGLVNNIEFKGSNVNELVVAFTCDHRFPLPSGTRAELFSEGIIGGRAIKLIPGKSPVYHNYGDTLVSAVEMDLISQVQEQLDPLTQKAELLFGRADSLFISVNQLLNEETITDLKETISNLNSTTEKLSKVQIDQILTDLKQFTQMLAENREKLAGAINNLNNITDSIARSNLNQALTEVENTFRQSSHLLESINNGEGSLGQLAKNDSLYLHLNAATQNLEILLKDLNENPKRYVHFSLFGRKDKKKD